MGNTKNQYSEPLLNEKENNTSSKQINKISGVHITNAGKAEALLKKHNLFDIKNKHFIEIDPTILKVLFGKGGVIRLLNDSWLTSKDESYFNSMIYSLVNDYTRLKIETLLNAVNSENTYTDSYLKINNQIDAILKQITDSASKLPVLASNSNARPTVSKVFKALSNLIESLQTDINSNSSDIMQNQSWQKLSNWYKTTKTNVTNLKRCLNAAEKTNEANFTSGVMNLEASKRSLTLLGRALRTLFGFVDVVEGVAGDMSLSNLKLHASDAVSEVEKILKQLDLLVVNMKNFVKHNKAKINVREKSMHNIKVLEEFITQCQTAGTNYACQKNIHVFSLKINKMKALVAEILTKLTVPQALTQSS